MGGEGEEGGRRRKGKGGEGRKMRGEQRKKSVVSSTARFLSSLLVEINFVLLCFVVYSERKRGRERGREKGKGGRRERRKEGRT